MNKPEIIPKILIGLEIHITLNSQKKVFNWVDTYKGDSKPNSQISAWELGYLGTLPIINPEVIYLGLKLAAALGMKVSKEIIFDRKIYNYFDLPKGYQITQHTLPFAISGYLPVTSEDKTENVSIKVLQIEEDTAKSSYDAERTKLDFNRAGNPLIELVTEPVFQKLEDVSRFIKQLQNLLRYLEVSEAKMEKGQLRVDLNFSLQLGEKYSTPRYEIKNLNSLANIDKAVKYEIKKHQSLSSQGKTPPLSQTLGFDESQQATISHREKTNYFYLPEVNIPPIKLKTSEIKKIRDNLPKLPWVYWKELKQFDLKSAQEINKNPDLLKILNFLEKKKTFELKESKNWIIFYANYLSPFFGDNGKESFVKKWNSYYSLFQYWREKKLENEEIKEIIIFLKETEKDFDSLIGKYEKKFSLDKQILEKELKNLWNDELEKMLPINQQKVQNYLLGQVKKKFPDYSVKEIILTIGSFLEKNKS